MRSYYNSFQMGILLAVFISASLVFIPTEQLVKNCGKRFKNQKCDGGRCCGIFNNECGLTETECGKYYCNPKFGECGVGYQCGPMVKKKCSKNGYFTLDCCNKDGRCGRTEEYCGAKCDANWGNCGFDNQCGPTVKKRCTGEYSDYCCGKDGYCSKDRCELSKCDLEWGKCGEDDDCGPTINKTCSDKKKSCCNGKTWKCGSSYEDCLKGNCKKEWGVCKKVYPPGRCGSGFGETKCPDGECCNKSGHCGTTDEHCGANCLLKYGKCGKDYNCGSSHNGVCTGNFRGHCCSSSGNCGTTDTYCGSGCQIEYGVCSVNWTTPRQIKSGLDGECLQHTSSGLDVKPCDRSKGQKWLINEREEQFKSLETGKCLQVGRSNGRSSDLLVEPCDLSIDQRFVRNGKRIQNVNGKGCMTSEKSSQHPIPYISGCLDRKQNAWTVTYV